MHLSIARNQERKAKRAAELKTSKAKKEEVAKELARLEEESKEEEKRVEVCIWRLEEWPESWVPGVFGTGYICETAPNILRAP